MATTAGRTVATDSRHPLTRRLMRRLQLFAASVLANGKPPRLILLDEALGAIRDHASHIATARPRSEYDEPAQELLTVNGSPIGRLRRPTDQLDQLHPIIERAIEVHLTGDLEGDHDAENEVGMVGGVRQAVLS